MSISTTFGSPESRAKNPVVQRAQRTSTTLLYSREKIPENLYSEYDIRASRGWNFLDFFERFPSSSRHSRHNFRDLWGFSFYPGSTFVVKKHSFSQFNNNACIFAQHELCTCIEHGCLEANWTIRDGCVFAPVRMPSDVDCWSCSFAGGIAEKIYSADTKEHNNKYLRFILP